MENSMKKAFVLLLLFSALNITINCHEDCQNADYNNCRQIRCKGMYWSNSQGRCRQCSDHNQICRSCPDYYDDTTNSCKNTTNTSDSNPNKPNNGQNNSQSCQAISKSSCTTQPCERYFLNPSTNSCQKCSLASLSQCSMCEHHYFSTANICTMCTYNITNCTGCDSDSNAQCLHGCPHNYHLNSTSCVPEQVVQVNLVLNPSRLIPDWDNLTTNQKNSQATNSTEVKQAIYKLIGMENQTFRVQIKNIRAGSLNVDLIVYPSSLESPSSTSQKISSAIATNEQASGFTVLSNSVAVTKMNNADTSSSGISTVMIVCIAVGSVIGLTTIFIIVKCIKSRLAAQQESAQTISEKYMNSAEGAIKNPRAEKDEFELAAAASINTADS